MVQVRPPLLMPTPYRVPAAPSLTQLSANEPGKALEDDPHAWAPEHTRETQPELQVPGFSLVQPWPWEPFGE